MQYPGDIIPWIKLIPMMITRMMNSGALEKPFTAVEVRELYGTAGGPIAGLYSFIHIFHDLLSGLS